MINAVVLQYSNEIISLPVCFVIVFESKVAVGPLLAFVTSGKRQRRCFLAKKAAAL